VLSALYAAIVRRRREFYAARPDLRRRLRCPVVSVGNIAVGGRGKTPTVASLARLLLELGERPAVLSRGYARMQPDAGVVVVRDASGIRADLARAGDEPLMLARQLPGVSVLAASDRYLAGRLAELHLGATVHVLDDGFQHLQLDRDVDLVIVAGADLDSAAKTLPGGRLREPSDALLAANAVLAVDDQVNMLGPEPRHAWFELFKLRRTLGDPVSEAYSSASDVAASESTNDSHTGKHVPSLAVAGIAGPERFFDDLRAAGYDLTGTLAFRDHHPYSRRDLERIVAAARAAGGRRILTTEKDYVRMLPYRPFRIPVAHVPLTMEPDPLPEFRSWLAGELRAARDITE
jgi:tetraacyldisaccharide 4'-kinase